MHIRSRKNAGCGCVVMSEQTCYNRMRQYLTNRRKADEADYSDTVL